VYLSALERAVVQRVSAADIKSFNKIVTVLEQEAHQRVGSRGARPSRRRKKAAL
jgi:hypothetical protein